MKSQDFIIRQDFDWDDIKQNESLSNQVQGQPNLEFSKAI